MSSGPTRFRLETFKYVVYISVPLVFGYVLGRTPGFWEWTAQQLPSAIENQSGPYLPKELTEHRPTLQSEFQKLALERALDAALEEARKNKQAANKSTEQ